MRSTRPDAAAPSLQSVPSQTAPSRSVPPRSAPPLLLALLTVLAGCMTAESAQAQLKPALKNQKDKVSYSIGLDIGRNLKTQGIEVDPAAVAQGVKDAQAGGKTLLTEQEMQQVMTAFQAELRTKQAERMKTAGDKNKKDGEAFLAKNKSQAGVVTTASGLQYKVVKEGSGNAPHLEETVVANYKGTLIDGTEFDSSYKRGEPAKFPVSGVIAGWTEVLQLMKPGAKYQVFIPSNLGYGERGAGAKIGPNSTLIFDIELVEVQK